MSVNRIKKHMKNDIDHQKLPKYCIFDEVAQICSQLEEE